MSGVEPLLALLGLTTFALLVLAGVLAAALLGRGPLFGRLIVPRPRDADETEEPAAGIPIAPSIRFLARDPRPVSRREALARRNMRPPDDEGLDEVLQGTFAATTVNHAVRVLTWSFILAVLVIVSVAQLWDPVQPQIFVTLTLAGIFVLVAHELLPAAKLGHIRILTEASAAIVFLTMLVVLTGHAESPFFFLYALLVGGTALIASPVVTLSLAIEAAIAYAIAALTGPLEGDGARETMARVGINVVALMLLSYAGIVISRVQRRTRDAAIRLSTVDSLTCLYNRAYLFNAVDREIERGHRFKRGFCLLMMDLDGLKAINDRHGHYQGDLVLREVAQVIRSNLRRVDTPARYGGDEFVALLPETDPSGAYVVAEKIRREVADLLVEAAGQRVTTSLSIGVVSYPDDGDTADELMIAADEAMYSSKRLGKNRVVGYADPGESGAVARPDRSQIHMAGFRPLTLDDEARPPRPESGPPRGEPQGEPQGDAARGEPPKGEEDERGEKPG